MRHATIDTFDIEDMMAEEWSVLADWHAGRARMYSWAPNTHNLPEGAKPDLLQEYHSGRARLYKELAAREEREQALFEETGVVTFHRPGWLAKVRKILETYRDTAQASNDKGRGVTILSCNVALELLEFYYSEDE